MPNQVPVPLHVAEEPYARLLAAKPEIRALAAEWPLVHLLTLPPGSKMVVAGAYEGKLIELLDTVSPHCTIWGYEPVQQFMAAARERLNGYANVHLVESALSDDDRGVALAVDGVFTTAMRDAGAVAVHCPSVDMASLLCRMGWIDLVVLNVEGYEGKLLRHLDDQDALSRAKRVVVQFHTQYDDFFDVHHRMQDAGYRKVYDDFPRWVYWQHYAHGYVSA